MKSIYKILFLAGLVFLLSCKDEAGEIVKTLDVESTTIQLDNKEQTITIPVKTDPGDTFTAKWVGDNWGEISSDLSLVTIKVKANEEITKREGALVLSLTNGMRTLVVDVVQSGIAPTLDLIPSAINLDFLGGEITVKMESNLYELDDSWDVTSDDDWIDIQLFPESKEMILTIPENEVEESRTTTIKIVNKLLTKELTITQEAALGFLIPYLDFSKPGAEDFMKYESERHSVLMYETDGSYRPYRFSTKSKTTPFIEYAVNEMESQDEYVMNSAVITLHADINPLEYYASEQFKAVMEENGFIRTGNSILDTYWNDNNNIFAMFTNAGINMVFASGSIPDHKETFDKLPYPPSDLAWKTTKEQVLEWERTHGGTVLGQDEGSIMFLINNSKEFVARHYLFDPGLWNIQNIMYDYDKVYTETNFGIIANPNFQDLLDAEGFEYLFDGDESQIYSNDEKELILEVMLRYFIGTGTNIRVVVLSFYDGAGQSRTVSTLQSDERDGSYFSRFNVK